MATYLYRLGGWAFDNRRKVLFAWIATLVAVVVSSFAFSGQFSSKFEVPGTESQQAQDAPGDLPAGLLAVAGVVEQLGARLDAVFQQRLAVAS